MQNNAQLRPLHDRLALQNISPQRQKKRKEDGCSKVESVHEIILIDSDDDDFSDWVQIVNDNGAKWPSPLPNNNNKACLAKEDIQENGSLSESGPKLECPICFDLVPFSNGAFLECEVMLTILFIYSVCIVATFIFIYLLHQHFFCNDCLVSYIETEIGSLAASGFRFIFISSNVRHLIFFAASINRKTHYGVHDSQLLSSHQG
jgi:hypothetical protein